MLFTFVSGTVPEMAPSYPQTGKLTSAGRTKGGFIKKLQSSNLGDNLNTASSDDDEDLPHIGRTSGTNPEDSKNLHGVNAGTNTPRTPCATMISPKKREFSPLGEEANMCMCKRMSATLTALRAGSDMPEEVPEPHYPQGTSHLVRDTDKNGSNSCWRREPFVAPRNVEKSSTSSHISCKTSSLQYSSKPVHSPVYVTGRYTKQSSDNSCLCREPFLIAKNMEKTSTLLL